MTILPTSVLSLHPRKMRQQPADQACRDPADSVHQQEGRSACGVAATGLSDGVEDRGSPPVAVPRQSCVAGDHSDQPDDQACRNSAVPALPARVDAATVSSYVVQDRGRPTVAVHRQICAAGDQPGDQACRDSADPVHQQVCGRAYCDTATGTSGSDCAGDSGSPDSPDGAVRRQS